MKMLKQSILQFAYYHQFIILFHYQTRDNIKINTQSMTTDNRLLMKKKPEAGNAYVSPTRAEKSQSLSDDFFKELLGQQEAFKKSKNKQNLTRLIILYRMLVEHYSAKGDKIQMYFSEKISNTSSQMLDLQDSDERVTMSMAKQIGQDEKNMNDPRFKQIIPTTVAYDPELKKKQRSKNAQIAIEVNKVKKRANARTILKSYYEQWEQNNKIIMNDLKNQRKQLQDKLMAIHKKSLDAASKQIVI